MFETSMQITDSYENVIICVLICPLSPVQAPYSRDLQPISVGRLEEKGQGSILREQTGPQARAQCKRGGTSACMTLTNPAPFSLRSAPFSPWYALFSAHRSCGARTSEGECAHWPAGPMTQWPEGHGLVVGYGAQVGDPCPLASMIEI